jgi:hypothetical protein
LPWWVKNWLATGFPFYPLWGRVGATNPYQMNFSLQSILDKGWVDSLLLPWNMTVQGAEGSPGFGASIGPLLLSLAPFVWWGASKRTSGQRNLIKLSLLISLVGLVVWTLGAGLADLLIQTRLYYALFPAFAILATGGFYALDRVRVVFARIGTVRLGRVLGVLLALVFGLNSLQVSLASLNSGAPEQVAGFLSDQDYLAHNLGLYSYAMRAIRDIPQSSKVLMLWEARDYYCQPACVPDPFLDNWRRLASQASNVATPEIAAGLAKQGFTHVLYYKTGADFVKNGDMSYTPSEWQALEYFLDGLPEPVDIGEAYRLYSLNK